MIRRAARLRNPGIQGYRGQRASTSGLHREIWRAATTYIDEHLATRLSGAEIARAALTSERQLQRVFSLVGHTTVRAYVTRARMRRAAALVLTTDAPLAAVAAQVGYGHVSAFVKAFRVHHGVTPAELRRRCSKSADFGLDRLLGDPAGRPSR